MSGFAELDSAAELVVASAKRIMSLKEPSIKMSKSEQDSRSRIDLTDSPEEISRKVRQALTDSEPGISYDPIARPGLSNLLVILSHLRGQDSPEDLGLRHKSLSLRQFKEMTTTIISEHLYDFRLRYQQLTREENVAYLDDVATRGAQKARNQASLMMQKVRIAIGLS